jgi:hypothetical protein
MPDGALVELPDDADDALKEKIRQKVEAIRSQQQPSEAPPTPIGGVQSATDYGQQMGAPTIGEQRQMVSEIPKGIRDPLEAAAETASGFVPKTALQVAEFATPLVSAVENVSTIPKTLSDVFGGQKSTDEIFPESTLLSDAEKTPPFSKERYRAGFEVLGQLGMAASIGRGMIPEKPSLSSALRTLTEKPESPTPLSDAATKEVTDATQTGQIAESIPTERTGDDRFRPPAETVGGGGLQPATEEPVPLETREPDAARSGVEGRTSELPAVEPSPESVAATEPKASVAIPEATAPAPEEKPTTYFKGDKAEYTGNTHELHGGTFYEVKMLEGADAGKTKVVTNPPKVEKITLAAVKTPSGEIVTGVNHADALEKAGPGNHESGFVTSTGRFLSPDEAYAAADNGMPVETPEITSMEKRIEEAGAKPTPKLRPGEKQGDLLSTQSEPLQLVGEKGVDYDAIQKKEQSVSGLQGYAMGTAGAKEIPIRGWKEMLESGEKSPIETGDAIERAKGEVGKVLDTVGGAIRSLRDFLTVKPIPKLERAGLSDAAYEHASARNSVVHSVRHLLSRVFPDSYKNPAEMQRTGDILTKDNILGVYDQAKTRLEDAEPGTKEYDAAAEAVNKIEEAHNLAAYDRDVKEAMNDPQISKNIDRWKTWVNPEMDRMYNEIKSLDPWTIQESRGRHFDARINLLPLNQAADLAKFTDMSHGMPDLVTSNYRNPNIKADPFMRRAAGTGQYSTDPGLILTNSLARRYNEVTKLRFYNAVEKTGNGFIADAGVRPTNTDGLTRLAIKMPETNPETGLTRPVEKSLWIKNDLAREARDVLNTDMAAPTNPVFKALTQVQLLQLADATAHMKNIHTVLANSLGASKPWQDAVRKLPFLSTADTVGRIASVVREVASDTPAIRDEIAQMAKQGMIRPKYPSTGIQKITKMQDAIHHVDTAARIVMNRFWDNLSERGYVTDTPAARRQFVQQIGEYNGRLMGHFSRTLRNYGASPFVVAGRTFNAFSKRLLTGDPGFKAATPQAAAMARAYQLTALTMATTVPAIINYATTGKFGGRPGTPIGAIDTGMNNEKGDKKIIDLFQLMGIRRGLRATGLGAVTEGLREGKSFNEIGGKAIEDITTTASHPWIGPGLGAMYSGISGKRLDLRGGAWPYAAKQVKEGGLKQYGENLRVTLKNQNPLLYGILAPLVGETEDTYTQGLAHGLLKAPMSAVGYVEKPGDSAFKAERSKKSSGVKVRP